MTKVMDIAAEFILAPTDEAQEAVILRNSAGLVRKGLRHIALQAERFAERTTGDEAAKWSQAATQAWNLRDELTGLVSADDPVAFDPDPEFTDAIAGAAR